MNVLLVHGLGRTPVSLFVLAGRLRRSGHRTHFCLYSPTLEPVDRIVRRLAARLKKLAQDGGPVGVVGHSLGGILSRSALAMVPDASAILVMLGTPNRPPRLARWAWRLRVFRWFAGDCGHLLAFPERMAAVPAPVVSYTLIAGTAGPRGPRSPFGDDLNDGVVAVAETPVRDDDEVLLYPVWHTMMMNDREVCRAVVAALAGELRGVNRPTS